VLFEACSAFTHITACMLAESLSRPSTPKAPTTSLLKLPCSIYRFVVAYDSFGLMPEAGPEKAGVGGSIPSLATI
jgi:hypothetical protein